MSMAIIFFCQEYHSSGTSYSQYNILMKGDDACCVVSSHMTQKCSWIKRWNELEIVIGCDAMREMILMKIEFVIR